MAIKTLDWEAESEQRERNRRIIRQKYFQIQKICVRHSISAWCSDTKFSTLCSMFCDGVCLWITDKQEHPSPFDISTGLLLENAEYSALCDFEITVN